MLGRIEAGERKAAIFDRAAASGGLIEEAQSEHMAQLDRMQAGEPEPKRDRTPPSPEALAAMGIAVVMPEAVDRAGLPSSSSAAVGQTSNG